MRGTSSNCFKRRAGACLVILGIAGQLCAWSDDQSRRRQQPTKELSLLRRGNYTVATHFGSELCEPNDLLCDCGAHADLAEILIVHACDDRERENLQLGKRFGCFDRGAKYA